MTDGKVGIGRSEGGRSPVPVTVAVPTFQREQVLVDTVKHLLAQHPPAAEIVVLDQSPRHASSTEEALTKWRDTGCIRWMRMPEPSITRSMNEALRAATFDLVLFVDDDVVPAEGLVAAHFAAHRSTGAAVIAGRVVQPWDEGKDFTRLPDFHFAQPKPAWVHHFIGANVSVDRRVALDLGGFDENFVKVAYQYEYEFSYRVLRAGHRIYFEPRACLRHLKAPAGGTRSRAHHLRTWRPDHTVGRYYALFRTWAGWRSLPKLASFPFRAVMTKHHARRPWWIPVSLTAEALGLVWAGKLALEGPRYASRERGMRGAAITQPEGAGGVDRGQPS